MERMERARPSLVTTKTTPYPTAVEGRFLSVGHRDLLAQFFFFFPTQAFHHFRLPPTHRRFPAGRAASDPSDAWRGRQGDQGDQGRGRGGGSVDGISLHFPSRNLLVKSNARVGQA